MNIPNICPKCGGVMEQGKCLDMDCMHHWIPIDGEYIDNLKENRPDNHCFIPEQDNVYPLCDDKDCPLTTSCNISAYMDETPYWQEK